jgi:hypothetical protein
MSAVSLLGVRKLTNSFHGEESYLRIVYGTLSKSRNPPHFMELTDASPCSTESPTGTSPRCSQEDNININLKEAWHESVDWIQLAQVRGTR